VAITITLTDGDADDYIILMQERQAVADERRRFREMERKTFDTPLTPPSAAELQKEIDALWAAKGVRSEEILTSPEDAARILAEVGAPVPDKLSDVIKISTIEQATEFFGEKDANTSELDTAALFGGSLTGALTYDTTTPRMTLPAGAVVVVNPPAPPQVITPPGPPPIVAIAPTLDKDGLPWDQRIHSGSKAINKDGTWRTKKNLDPATLAVVTAELKQVMGIPSPVASTNIPQPPTNAAPAPFQPPVGPAAVVGDAAAAFAAKQIPLIPPVPAVPFAPAVPVPPPSGAAPITSSVQENSAVLPLPPTTAITASLSNTPPTLSFGELIFKVSQGVAQGTLTDARVTEVCAKHGLPGGQIVLIGSRPDLIPQVAKDLGLM
jgi:hypothetical protein